MSGGMRGILLLGLLIFSVILPFSAKLINAMTKPTKFSLYFIPISNIV
jgi:hypothetical protein